MASMKKDIFIMKKFGTCNMQSLLIGIEGSGIIKIKYTEKMVEITLWDNACENIVQVLSCSHQELLTNKPSD
jgi:hypothetical protein